MSLDCLVLGTITKGSPSIFAYRLKFLVLLKSHTLETILHKLIDLIIINRLSKNFREVLYR